MLNQGECKKEQVGKRIKKKQVEKERKRIFKKLKKKKRLHLEHGVGGYIDLMSKHGGTDQLKT